MPTIFISYRRADSKAYTGRIYDRLVQAYGKDSVFKDVDSIPIGSDFRGVLNSAVSEADVLLAIIGQQWVTVSDQEGKRRLDDPRDYVKLEIQLGLQRRECLVVPVLVDGAKMPRKNDLPEDLSELAYRNGIAIGDDPDFHKDVDRLIEQINSQYDLPQHQLARKSIKLHNLVPDGASRNSDVNTHEANQIAQEILSLEQRTGLMSEAETYYRMGHLFFIQDQFQQAVELYSKAIAIYPDFYKAYYGRALTFQKMSKFAEAMKDFDAGDRLNPDKNALAATLHNLATTYASMGNHQQALDTCERVISTNPTYLHVYFLAAESAEALHLYEKAKTLLSQYIILSRQLGPDPARMASAEQKLNELESRNSNEFE